MPKPILFGYQVVRLDTTRADFTRGRELLTKFALLEGFALAEIFVERDVNRPCSALVALIEASHRNGVAAIAVPTPADLGRIPRVQRLMRDRLEREAGVRVLIVEPVKMTDPGARLDQPKLGQE